MNKRKMLYIRSLHGFVICRESLNLEPKYACIVAHMLFDTASNCAPISLNALHASGTGKLKQWIHSPDQGSTRK